MVSELFLIDAEQCSGTLLRFAEARPGQGLAATAEAAHALADLMGTLAQAADADCARRLALHLAQPAESMPLPLLRGHAATLVQRQAAVVQALRGQSQPPDGAAFAAAWLAGLPPLAQADGGPTAAVPLPVTVPPAAAPAPAALVADPHAGSEAERDETAGRRRVLLAQARRLHDSLPAADAAMRAGLEPVIADLLTQVCRPWLPDRRQLAPVRSAPVLVSTESADLLAAALAVLPAGADCSAGSQGGVVFVEVALDPASLADTLLAALSSLIASGGGCMAQAPGGLRLSLPRDHHRIEVQVMQDAQGLFAVPALQAGAWVTPPAVVVAGPVKAWRHAVPGREAWPRPADWLDLVSCADGRLLPLRAPPTGHWPCQAQT